MQEMVEARLPGISHKYVSVMCWPFSLPGSRHSSSVMKIGTSLCKLLWVGLVQEKRRDSFDNCSILAHNSIKLD